MVWRVAGYFDGAGIKFKPRTVGRYAAFDF